MAFLTKHSRKLAAEKNNKRSELAEISRCAPELPYISITVEKMENTLNASEVLAFSVQKGLQSSSKVITETRLQNENLGEFDNRLQQAASEVNLTVGSVKEINGFINTQADAINSVGASIEQMTSAVRSTAIIVTDRLNVSHALSESANDGIEKVKRVLDVIEILNKNVGAIKSVITSINTISSQTNLLAMNAAIEAAHAGKAGLGFAVVADEIRKLSEITRTNASNIAVTLKSMIKTLDEARNTADAAGSAMSWIGDKVGETSRSFEEITTHMRDLNSGSDEVLKAVHILSSSAGELRSRSSTVTLKLSDISQNVKDISKSSTNVRKKAAEIAGYAGDSIFALNGILDSADKTQSFLDDAVDECASMTRADPFRFTFIVLRHLRWVTRVRAIIDGKMAGDEMQIGDHHSCDLGKWLDNEMNSAIRSSGAYARLYAEHETLHAIVRDIFAIRHTAAVDILEEKYVQLLKQSGLAINLLIELRKVVSRKPGTGVSSV